MALRLSPQMTVMQSAAQKAAKRLLRDFSEVEQLQVSVKGPSDFVSQADIRAEQTVREELAKARPGYAFLMEESGTSGPADWNHRWVVDPLDGTTNFLHGMPHFAISIAAEERGEIVAGLVYQPLTDESFWAEKGKGAWLQDRRLRVSSRRDMSECVIATGIPFAGRGDQVEFSKILNAVMPNVAGIRRFGSAALDLAWVAAGRFDAYWENGLQYWDVAAGLLLVREAGGFVTDYRGKDGMIGRKEIIAGNDQVQSKLHKLVAGAIR